MIEERSQCLLNTQLGSNVTKCSDVLGFGNVHVNRWMIIPKYTLKFVNTPGLIVKKGQDIHSLYCFPF